ncbi:MAG: RNA methyltransferase [Bdellovibrionales bacterium]|nr:RNA methyltransferase [Bdellovibrionales bacterium]
MPLFYAATSRGLAEPLAEELRSMGLKVKEVDKQGCSFDGPWTDAVKANLRSRIATRISLPVLDFTAYKEDELYHNVMKHDFTKYLTPELTFSVKAKSNDCAIKDQRMLAMKVKDAIADQFNEKFGKRPSVDKETPNIRIHIFGSRNEYRLSVDTTGKSLSQRGYRKDIMEAPMREHVAAGLLKLSGWDQTTTLIDPMCGSGTLLIEAALMYKHVAPGTFHKKFSFQYFQHIEEGLFESELDRVIAEEDERAAYLEDLPEDTPKLHFYGFDKSFDAIKAAKKNAEAAGVEDMITFEKGDATRFESPVEKGLIVTNPPHGIRLGDEFFLEELYKNFSFHLKKNFSGWDMWLLSGDAQWTRFLKMKAEKRYPIDNGGIDCRWIHYKVK